MPRRKVPLAYIVNERKRKETYTKRRKGLMKSLNDLSTLCGVSACAIMYGPRSPTPEVWPEQSEVHHLLMRFLSLPEIERWRKQLSPETYMSNQIQKINEKCMKQQHENRCMEINEIFDHILAGKSSISDVHETRLDDLYGFLERKEKEILLRLSQLEKASTSVAQTTLSNTGTANITALNPNTNVINTNVGAGGVNVPGINGGTLTGDGMYYGVVNHYNHQGGTVDVRGSNGQENMASYQLVEAMDALQIQPCFLGTMNPISISQLDDQMTLGGASNI